MLPFATSIRLFFQAVLLIIATAATAEETVYPVDQLNAGLADAPDKLDRSSPMATMEALLDLSEANDFDTAAHLLNLATVPEGQQAEKGPQLAAQLYSVIDRKVVISWSELLDRPDALDASATSNSAVAGMARRSILLWILTIDDRPYPIRLDRIQAGDAAPVWVFSERSVANIERLYDTFGPSEMEEKLPSWARQNAFWNLMWWEIIGLPIMLLLAGIGGFVAHRAMSWAATSARRNITTEIIQSARLPIVIFVVTSIISAISQIFVFSGPIAAICSPLVALGYVVSALMLVANVVDSIIDRLVEMDNADLKLADQDHLREMATKASLARRILVVLIVIIGFGLVLAQTNIFRNFGFSLLASAGALTLLLGFAAREVLSNIMCSMQIAMNRSARIGDKVVYKGEICDVERINFTYVLLRVWTGTRLVVPVTEFVSETFENWMLKEPQMLRLVDIRVAHSADVGQLRDAFFDVLDEVDQEQRGDAEENKVVVTDQDVFGQVVSFCVSCANPNTSWDLSCDVRERLIRRMQAMEKSGAPIFPNVNPAEGA